MRALNFKSASLLRAAAGAAGAQEKALQAEIDDLLAQHSRVEARIAEASPAYAALIRPQPVSESGMRRLLDPAETLLVFSLGHRASFLWVVTKDGFEARRLPARAQIEKWARAVLELVPQGRERARDPAAAAELRRALRDLSAALFPGFTAEPGQTLIVAADGILHRIPFAALPEPGRAEGSLGLNHELVHVPSSSVIAAMRSGGRTRPRAGKTLAVMADPVFGAGDPRVRAADSRAGQDFARLPFSRIEAEEIEQVVTPAQTTKLLGFAASKAALITKQWSRYRILHVSSHAVIDDVRPDLSGIALTSVTENGKPVDGFLRVQEVYNLDLPLDLVVLSACRTAGGRQLRGEGLLGFTRALFYAAVKGAVTTLWPVEDHATAEFMRLFYESLCAGGDFRPAAALTEARKRMAVHPRWNDHAYWAGFVFQGDWQP
jgi:CHAT domain-containing protein